ncbi:MAG TPA: YihY/virulence factor BrkB family protein [Stellaceae bacterium]|nr:YihY/virulence factor BrkB family protein [Stellaceae bacterium]
MVVAILFRVGRDNISILAAGVAFYAFVAIPSSLAVVVSFYGMVFNPVDVGRFIDGLAWMLPGDVIVVVSGFLKTLTTNPGGQLGRNLIIGLVGAVWSTQSGTSSLISALNAAYEEREDRGFVTFQATSLVITLGTFAFAILGLGLLAAVPLALAFLSWDNVGITIAAALRWPLMFLLVGVALAALYRYAPSRAPHARSWGFRGVLFATVAWIGASALFSLYVRTFASYDRIFGPLGAVVVLLLWLYLTIFVVLIGAELNAEIEQRSS